MSDKSRKTETAPIRAEKDNWHLRVLSDRSLSKAALKVAGFIFIKFNISETVFRWGQERMASELAIGETTVRSALRNLEGRGYLLRLDRRDQNGVVRYALNGVGATGRPLPVIEDGDRQEFEPQPACFDSTTGRNDSNDRQRFAAVPLGTPEKTQVEGGCAPKAQQPPSTGTAENQFGEAESPREKPPPEIVSQILDEGGYTVDRLRKAALEKEQRKRSFAENISDQWPERKDR